VFNEASRDSSVHRRPLQRSTKRVLDLLRLKAAFTTLGAMKLDDAM
jgi:hypothetical protein